MKKTTLIILIVFSLSCSDERNTAMSSGTPSQMDMRVSAPTDIFIVQPDPVDMGVGMEMGTTTPSSVCIEPPEVEPMQVSLATNCRSGNGPKRIQDYRNYRCDDYFRFGSSDRDTGRSENSLNIVLDDVLVTGVFDTDFSVQDPEGGAFSGLWVYTDRRQLPFPLVPGMRVRLSGQLMEFFGLTELRLDNGNDAIQQLPRTGPEPEPILVTDPALIADDGYLVKELESLLVRVPSQFIISTTPDCPYDYDMFVINGGLRIEDEVELSYEPKRGDFVDSVTGILHFSFDTQKVMPRNDADLVITECGGVPDKCEASDCLFDVGAVETGGVVISEIQDDPRGADGPREYVELYNATAEAVSLTGWRLQNCTEDRVELSGRIEPGAFFVIAGSTSRDQNGGISADMSLSDLSLPNGNGSLLLIDDQEQLVDQVRYLDEAPWPVREDGESLEVLTLTGDNSNGAVWRAGRVEYGEGGWGTPGAANN